MSYSHNYSKLPLDDDYVIDENEQQHSNNSIVFSNISETEINDKKALLSELAENVLEDQYESNITKPFLMLLIYIIAFLSTVFILVTAILGLVLYAQWKPFIKDSNTASSSIVNGNGDLFYHNLDNSSSNNNLYSLNYEGYTINALGLRTSSSGILSFGDQITISQTSTTTGGQGGIQFQNYSVNGANSPSLLTLYSNGTLLLPGTLFVLGPFGSYANFTQMGILNSNGFIDGNLYVAGNATLEGSLSVSIAISPNISSSSSISSATNNDTTAQSLTSIFQSNVIFLQNVTVNNTVTTRKLISASDVDDGLLSNTSITVTGAATFKGGILISDLTSSGDLDIPSSSYYQIGGTNVLWAVNDLAFMPSTTVQGLLLIENNINGSSSLAINYDSQTGYPCMYSMNLSQSIQQTSNIIEIGMTGQETNLTIHYGNFWMGTTGIPPVIDAAMGITAANVVASNGISLTGGNINIPAASYYQIDTVGNIVELTSINSVPTIAFLSTNTFASLSVNGSFYAGSSNPADFQIALLPGVTIASYQISTGTYGDTVQIGLTGETVNFNIISGTLHYGSSSTTILTPAGNIYGNTITSTGGVAVTGTNGTGTTGLYVGSPGGSLPPGGFGLFTGTVAAYGFSQLSSSAVKNNITVLDRKQALKVVMDMEPVTFFYNDDVIISTKAFPEGAGRSAFPNVGFIAQQTENVTRGYNGIITENTVPLKGGPNSATQQQQQQQFQRNATYYAPQNATQQGNSTNPSQGSSTYTGPGISLPSFVPFAVGAIQEINLQLVHRHNVIKNITEQLKNRMEFIKQMNNTIYHQ